ncbi:hypothetical protein NL676_008820 [Syzygium grande]|nr:hypothetical protein NL676_008820 [Syzygium grande]
MTIVSRRFLAFSVSTNPWRPLSSSQRLKRAPAAPSLTAFACTVVVDTRRLHTRATLVAAAAAAAAAVETQKNSVEIGFNRVRDLENKAGDLSKLQKDIAKNHQVRKKYTIQLGENELVLKELDLLNEDANVYKLIGPVLVKQDLAEANANVCARELIISLKRLDATLQDLEEKQNSKRDTILKLQQRIQSLQAGKAKA